MFNLSGFGVEKKFNAITGLVPVIAETVRYVFAGFAAEGMLIRRLWGVEQSLSAASVGPLRLLLGHGPVKSTAGIGQYFPSVALYPDR